MQNSNSKDGAEAQQSKEAEVSTSSSHNAKPHVSCCTSCNGEGEVEKNIHRGEEGMQIEMDVMVVCSECDGDGYINGIWRKTNKCPKPVGVPLLIRTDKGVEEKTHSGETHFYSDGRLLMNTVYSYDLNEEWFDDGSHV